MYLGKDLTHIGYTDSNFQLDKDWRKSTSGLVFIFGGGTIVWRSSKQSSIADSTMEAEYVVASEASKKAVWPRKFLGDLEVISDVEKPIIKYCTTVGQWQSLRNQDAIKKTNTINVNIIILGTSMNEGCGSLQNCIGGKLSRSICKSFGSQKL